jgi:hypothetical protein
MSKPFEPTLEQREYVEQLVSFGIPQEAICRLIKNPETGQPIDDDTLRKYFSEEIATGLPKANAKVGKSMFQMATESENPSTRLGAASFWLARRAGWKETTVQEHVGDTTIRIDDARQKLIEELDRVAARKTEKGDNTE